MLFDSSQTTTISMTEEHSKKRKKKWISLSIYLQVFGEIKKSISKSHIGSTSDKEDFV